VPLETPVRIVGVLAERGYNAEREAVTLLADAPDPERALERALETVPDDTLVLSTAHVRTVLDAQGGTNSAESTPPPEPSAPKEPPTQPKQLNRRSRTDPLTRHTRTPPFRLEANHLNRPKTGVSLQSKRRGERPSSTVPLGLGGAPSTRRNRLSTWWTG
jgi:hypothetical protein